MVKRVADYESVVGSEVIEKMREKAQPLRGKHITNMNSVHSGGGVAEILNSLVVLLNDLGVKVGWRILKGTHSFYDVTKTFHNGLQGEEVTITDDMKDIYHEETQRNAEMTHFTHTDFVLIHDPQPLALIDSMSKQQPWVWRCHIDLSRPSQNVWDFLEPYVKKYDGMVVSMEQYKRGLDMNEHIISPSIDPLSKKNKELTVNEAREIIEENGLNPDKPMITQIGRFDKWKDPVGCVSIFEKVRKEEDCQLILMGDTAADDPESQRIYVDVVNRSEGREDITIISKRDDLLVNALQKMSHVVLQNSKREGFGLTVAEALWKRTPVVTRPCGGIPLQVQDGENGFLVRNEDEAAERVVELLRDEELRDEMGWNGREHVKKNFLITRHVIDYLDLFNTYIA